MIHKPRQKVGPSHVNRFLVSSGNTFNVLWVSSCAVRFGCVVSICMCFLKLLCFELSGPPYFMNPWVNSRWQFQPSSLFLSLYSSTHKRACSWQHKCILTVMNWQVMTRHRMEMGEMASQPLFICSNLSWRCGGSGDLGINRQLHDTEPSNFCWLWTNVPRSASYWITACIYATYILCTCHMDFWCATTYFELLNAHAAKTEGDE